MITKKNNTRVDLTPRQRETLAWVKAFIRDHGMPPTVREIGDAFGIKSSSAFHLLKELEHKGYIERGELGARSLIVKRRKRVPCGCAMVHTHTLKNGNRRYRYYVCLNAQKRGWHACPSKSIPAAEIEKFVVDQVWAVGRDPAVVVETIRQTRAQAKRRVKELQAEQAALEKDLQRHNDDMRSLVSRLGHNGTATDRMADVQDRIRSTEQRATRVREELIALGRQLVDEKEAARAMALFDPVWESLSPREQVRVMQLLVERMDYDGEKGTVSVTFHPTGMGALADLSAASSTKADEARRKEVTV